MMSRNISFLDEMEEDDHQEKHSGLLTVAREKLDVKQEEERKDIDSWGCDDSMDYGNDEKTGNETYVTTMSEHLSKLLTELQTKRNATSENKIVEEAKEAQVESVRTLMRRAMLAEQGAHCAATAARRMATDYERANSTAAEARAERDTLVQENELLTRQLRTLRAESVDWEQRSQALAAEQAAREAELRQVLATLDKIKAAMKDHNCVVSRAEGRLERLETEISELNTLREQVKAERELRDARETALRERLQAATAHITRLQGELNILRTKTGQED